MNAFNHNIKLIRALTKKKQPEFARLIKSNTSNIKTWETTETLPTDVLIYSRLAELAGVSENDLKTKKLSEKDIILNVEKVDEKIEKGSSYLKLLESNDQFFKNEYSQLLLSLNKLINLHRKQEALIKLNLEHVGTVEALQKGIEPEVVHEQINNQIAELGTSEQTDNDDRI